MVFVNPGEQENDFKFQLKDSAAWVIVNYSVDVAFLFDIIICFLSTFQDDDM